MAVEVVGIVPDIARETWAKADVGSGNGHSKFSYFKIGCGGWTDSSGTKEPIDPTTKKGLTDLDCIENSGSYPAASQYYFQKSLTSGDIAYEADRKSRGTCTISFTEANDDGLGNPPEFWEIGIFDENDVMVVYGTFPKETKTSDKEIEKEIRIFR
jgi:hypothetical protein